MWRVLSEDEKNKLLKGFRYKSKIFNIMVFMFGLITIFLSIVCYEALIILIPTILICILFSMNIIIGIIIAIVIAIPFNVVEEVGVIAILAMYFFGFLINSQNYNTKMKLISNDYVKICKARIVRIKRANKYANTVTVKVMINDVLKEMDIVSGKNFNEGDDIYILAYGDNADQMELFKEKEVAEFL